MTGYHGPNGWVDGPLDDRDPREKPVDDEMFIT